MQNWKLKTITLYIYPYSTTVKTAEEYEKVQKTIQVKLPDATPPSPKKCPFPDCPITVENVDQLEPHKDICPFNPKADCEINRCLFVGCKKRFRTKAFLKTHFKICTFNSQNKSQLENKT